ncbi:unnamed protein product [Effrenium voratum]|nr:unnamed protein product [Effrenium voratum]
MKEEPQRSETWESEPDAAWLQRFLLLSMVFPKLRAEDLETTRPQLVDLLRVFSVKAQQQREIIEQQSQMLDLLEREMVAFKAQLEQLKARREARGASPTARSMLSSPQPSKPIQNQPELKAFPLAPFASMDASAHGELPASLGRLLTLEGASCHRDGRLRRTDYHPLRASLAMGCIKCASPGTGPEGGEFFSSREPGQLKRVQGRVELRLDGAAAAHGPALQREAVDAFAGPGRTSNPMSSHSL